MESSEKTKDNMNKITDFASKILEVDYYPTKSIFILLFGATILFSSAICIIGFNMAFMKPAIPIGTFIIVYSFIRLIWDDNKSINRRNESDYVLVHKSKDLVRYVTFIYMDGEEPRAIPVRELELMENGEYGYSKISEGVKIHCISFIDGLFSSVEYYNGGSINNVMKKYIDDVSRSKDENNISEIIQSRIKSGSSSSKKED